MSKYSLASKFIMIQLFLLLSMNVLAQNCRLTLEGKIVDAVSHEMLDYATIYVNELETGTITDSNGDFTLSDLCIGNYHISISHVGCEPQQLYISLTQDTSIEIELHHHPELLNELVVHGHEGDYSTQASNTIKEDQILNESNKNLGDVLSNIQGVSSLKTGGSISKPIIHGLYGNRISIINNGLVQAGQQWGNDHAPEIDVFTAHHISVIKGASALAYGGNSLGGVVLIEDEKIKEDPHVHGVVNYKLQSNGIGHTFNTKIEKYNDWAAWRLAGTLKFAGDKRSSNYYLTNTGNREYNLAATLEKSINNKWFVKGYYSVFTSQIAILRGSHIGNLTDLAQAFNRPIPFFTEHKFKYSIDAPKQQVIHHLVKLESFYEFGEHNLLKLTYGSQVNQRKEFDVRRSNRSETPALSLRLHNHNFSSTINSSLKYQINLKAGLQFAFSDNTNNPETDILPLIPDYRSTSTSTFFIFQQSRNRIFYEFGLRYNLRSLNALTISRGASKSIERFNHLFHNYAASSGMKIKFHPNYTMNFEAGYTSRSPEVNELYSVGLHQGVSGIEEGNGTLKSERSLKFVYTNDFNFKNRLFLQGLVYFQNINNYIYLQLEDELRLTIRGGFPVFTYQSTNANIFGSDILASISLLEELKLIVKYSIVRGKDLETDQTIAYLPNDHLNTTLTYAIKEGKKAKNSSIGLNFDYFFKPKNVMPEVIESEEEITIPVPEGYFLLGLKANTELKLKSAASILLSFSIDNLLNKSYRNYLNRQRYFADDEGININIGIAYKF